MSAARGRGRSTARRAAAAAVVTGLVATGALTGAGAAAATDGVQHMGGAVATLSGLKVYDTALLHSKGDEKPFRMPAGLFELTGGGGGTLKTYCIDLHNPTEDGTKYQETPWSESVLNKNENAGKIRWILQNSFPQVDDLTALAAKAGAKQLTEKTAAAGTQVAIWRYSDKANVTAADDNAERLADYLEKEAQNLEEPKASLTFAPLAVSGKPGTRIGPVTVTTNAARAALKLSPDAAGVGVKVVDEAGKPLDNAVNNQKVFFEVPADAPDGTAKLTASATTTVPVGRAFTPLVGTSQTMILAGSSNSDVTAEATASWARTGPVPAVTFKENCDKGGVDVTATNKGDSPFTFTLAGAEHTVPAGGSKTVTVPVDEDQAYDITITGPDGFKENFKGVLDCKPAGEPTPKPSSEPTPNTAGGSSTGGSTAGTTGSTTTGSTTGSSTGGDLAATGGSSATPMIAGIAIALVALGGGAVFFLRKKKAAAGE
ncbi:TQXA domain-containing protein [Streptomyces qinzhouensis]|uniref:TQXA domain-containing protein n=1 Tax=Streptomyces qinzhouensis TaxID=2599401 RepID=A0A5B8JGI0_9ACTN|nr:TQXA domain-containing protein [Streptomyces qinzhouensis]